MSKVSLGWIGCAHIHTPGFVNEVVKRGHHVVGVWDHDDARAAANAEKLSSTPMSTGEILANPDVDAFVVCSETVRHLDIVKALVTTDKPIFVEKPMGPNAADSAEMARLFEASGSVFQTGYFMRGNASIRTLKQMVADGAFGQITRIRASNCHSGALGGWFDTDWRWMADRSQAGVGAYGDLGTHVLDLLLWIFGPVTSVTGALGMGTARYEGCDEFGEAIIKLESGALATLTASWDDVAQPHMFQVSGTKGFATFGGDLQFAGPDGKFAPVELTQEAIPSGFNAFLDYLEGKPAELVTAAEAAERDRVMSAIYTGAESGTWISL